MSERSKLTAYFSVRQMLQDVSMLPCRPGPVERNVLMLMAGFADPDGSRIIQSYDSVSNVAGFSKSAVRGAVDFWLAANILTLAKPGGGRGHAPEYAIDLIEVGKYITDKGAFPEYLSGYKGAVEKHLSGNRKVSPESTKGATKVHKGAVERHPPSLPSLPSGEAVRRNQAKHIEGCPPHAVENPVQQPSISFKEVAAKKKHTAPPWVKGELAESLYAGIHNKKIADAFFDARLLNPRDRLAACVTAAVTTLAISRVATLKVLNANEIERRAFEELLGGLPTLELVQDFEARRRHTVQAVTRAVISVCVRMLDETGHGVANVVRLTACYPDECDTKWSHGARNDEKRATYRCKPAFR